MRLRTRLMLLYSVPFFVVGSLLVTVPLLGARQSSPVGSGPDPHPRPEITAFPVGTWLLALAGLVLISAGLGWMVSGRFLRPLRVMTETARDISATNLHRRLSVPRRGRDELAELAATLDQLFERLEASFTSQRHFVANASHELRTPLTAEKALLQVALADPAASVESLREACRQVLALSDTQERLIAALFALANGQQGVERPTELDLAEIAGSVLAGRSADGVTVRSALTPSPVRGDPQLAESLIANLVENALQHNVPGGWVEVITEPFDPSLIAPGVYAVNRRAPGGRLDGRIIVRNTGPVIPPDELDRLFEPFQRMRPARLHHGDGHGLGLAIVQAIADVHGAQVDAWTRPEGGLDVTITFRADAFPRS
ncbi:sensor histidine kinase [Actinoplanes sp. NPDC020271]|uniref:sensor histidine kinase n=1 Tax=Actinoplanes sp. NPDC020271 TaxID=3363896 RepID=UPI0037B82A27